MKLSRYFVKDGPVSRAWNSPWIGVPVWALFFYCCVWNWYHHIPATGKAIGALAVVAGIMSVREMRVLGKICWIALLVCMAWTEFRAIDRDRADAQQAENVHLAEERASFANVLRQQGEASRALIRQDQEDFQKTLKHSLIAEKRESASFGKVLNREQGLFTHERQLAESLNGRLLPGTEATPATSCSPRNGGVVLLLGDEAQHNAAAVTNFPHTVLQASIGKTTFPMIALDRDSEGVLTVLMDIRSADGRIIARLNRNGFVVNRNNYLEINSDRSNLHVEDEYGNEVLSVRYLNRYAIAVSGREIGLPKGMSYICASGGPKSADFDVELKP